MTTKILLKYINLSDFVLTVFLIILLLRKRSLEDFKVFGMFLGIRLLSLICSIPFLYFRRELGIDPISAYKMYAYLSWGLNPLLSVFHALTIYFIYRLAMKPLVGLQRAGQIIFRWVAGVSFGLALFFAVGPHAGANFLAVVTAQLNQGASILELCVLLFVCLAIRPLGLTFDSHIFGVCLGLGVSAATALVESAWLATDSARTLFSPMFLRSGTASLVAVSIWSIYFIKRDPERRMVLLPTTSPFFVWNSISEALGDDPGHVAISGFKPDMLADAELEELSRSSRREEFPRELEDGDSDDQDDDPRPPNAPSRQALLLESFGLN